MRPFSSGSEGSTGGSSGLLVVGTDVGEGDGVVLGSVIVSRAFCWGTYDHSIKNSGT